jgi:DNA-binding transcriptional MocR family regulator
MRIDVRIEHRYPEALPFLQRHGADTLAVLHDLLASAEVRDGKPIVQKSTRRIADDLFISKDTVHRRLRQLHRAGVIQLVATATAFAPPTYTVDLTGTGIALTSDRPRSI